MAWRMATLFLAKASCPAAESLGPSARLQCARQGPGSAPVGWLEGNAQADWQTIALGEGGRLAINRNVECSKCPLAAAFPGLVLAETTVRDAGISARFMFEDPQFLYAALARLTELGQAPSLLGCSSTVRAHPGSTESSLTARQEECLRIAQRLGYFDADRRASVRDLAKALGCHPATAHEHLRKAIQKAVANCAPASQVGTGAAA